MTSFQGESEKRQPRGSIWDGPFAWKYQNALLQILVGSALISSIYGIVDMAMVRA